MRQRIVERNHAAVVDELNNERAAALGRAGRKVEAAIERCRQIAARLELLDDEVAVRHVLADYRRARGMFERARWELCVHREALGLNDHAWVDRLFEPPPATEDVGRWEVRGR